MRAEWAVSVLSVCALTLALTLSRASAMPFVGHAAPDFSAVAVIDGAFKTVSLSDYAGKYLVLFFYPLDFTFVCPTEITAFSDRINEFSALNTAVVGVSVDSKYSHLTWTKMPRNQGGVGPLNIPLVADLTKKISRDYGVLKEEEGDTVRGLFIIDDKANIRQITLNDGPIGRSVDETLRLVRAIQHNDKHGEVCPANWQPGMATIVPEPEASRAFFAALA